MSEEILRLDSVVFSLCFRRKFGAQIPPIWGFYRRRLPGILNGEDLSFMIMAALDHKNKIILQIRPFTFNNFAICLLYNKVSSKKHKPFISGSSLVNVKAQLT